MVASVLKPSSLIHEIEIEQQGSINLFKFSNHLQERMELLLENKKAELITPEQMAELEAIGELDRIFTYVNATIAAQNVN